MTQKFAFLVYKTISPENSNSNITALTMCESFQKKHISSIVAYKDKLHRRQSFNFCLQKFGMNFDEFPELSVRNIRQHINQFSVS